jgi:hypothetical protein
MARKPAAENNARRLGQDRHVLAEIAPYQFEQRGLSCARPTGEYDQPGFVVDELAGAWTLTALTICSDSVAH